MCACVSVPVRRVCPDDVPAYTSGPSSAHCSSRGSQLRGFRRHPTPSLRLQQVTGFPCKATTSGQAPQHTSHCTKSPCETSHHYQRGSEIPKKQTYKKEKNKNYSRVTESVTALGLTDGYLPSN
ncbi:hypothetical protein BaRGS_00030797 [Batillaria attramentaria]|uniref:Uncharacterized protein n=1 Tax=Batillaria attramentaria TaxID=370345 RepID=A0ABD0JS76_9CAEN